MEIQKEKEAFEQWAIKASGGWASFSKSHGDVYANNKLQFAWETWQAAKAQVPEGFVLMPIKPTEKHLKAIYDNKNSTANAYRAVIEAQEPAND